MPHQNDTTTTSMVWGKQKKSYLEPNGRIPCKWRTL